MKVISIPRLVFAVTADLSAHIIRNPSKSFAKSVCDLSARCRWGVTGTPIQNRLTDLFSLFRFLQCAPFDDLKVFNEHVTRNWRAASDPISVEKLKTLINCLSLRRPKSTVPLPLRSDETFYLDFTEQERQHYDYVRCSTQHKLDAATQERNSTMFINALHWVNELRLICNHGTTNRKAVNVLENNRPSRQTWTALEAQIRFDQLDQTGLARCCNPECSQDLTSAPSSETETPHVDEPHIEESLELLCSSCFDGQARRANNFFEVCNHLPKCPKHATQHDGSIDGSSGLYMGADTPSKIRRLVNDLSDTPEGIKR